MQQGNAARGRTTWASGDDYTFIAVIVIFFGLGIYGWAAWTFYHAEISRGFAALAHWHIEAIRFISNDYDSLDRQLLHADYARVDLRGIYAAASSIGRFFRLPVSVVLIALAAACMVFASTARFARRLDLDSLIAEQSRHFRTISAFADRKLRLTAPAQGDPRPADPALHSGEWIARYGRTPSGRTSDQLMRAELARQLGDPWTGAAFASPAVRVLFAAFSLHLGQRRDEATAFLGDVAQALRPAGEEGGDGPDAPLALPPELVARADGLLRGPCATSAAAIAAPHAFTIPALMSVLTEARRRGGVLPPASFNGIKLVDRRLWYALNSLGFPSEGQGRTYHPNPCVEAAGARDHWAMETALARPMPFPCVDRALAAVRALDRQSPPRPAA